MSGTPLTYCTSWIAENYIIADLSSIIGTPMKVILKRTLKLALIYLSAICYAKMQTHAALIYRALASCTKQQNFMHVIV